ncbi:MAG: LacI family DNA-binding transcriptional regulator [Pseudomonadota bacterium]
MKKVTSQDVALRAGVSQSSVSRAFSKYPTESGVSDEMRKRILKAAEELGFRPNAIARTLITSRSRIIALLFSYLDNPFYALALEAFCLALQRNGYHAMVFMMPNTLAKVDEMVDEMIDYQVDGIITASVELSSALIEKCARRNVPIVMFNRTQETSPASAVTTDNIAGAREIARHLLSGGFERIAMLGGWEGASTNRDREFGFRAELAVHGQTLFAYARGDFDLETTSDATRRLFDVPPPDRPDAVFVTNDYMAFRAMSVLRHELKLRIPQEVGVVGFDDVPRAASPEYDLTSYRQPLDRMVEQSIDLLLRAIEAPETETERLSLQGRLIERSSARRTG